MSDEIEIEEHDLLDDPTVRNIFPDIARLKQEILDYEYNEEHQEPTSTTSNSHFDNIVEVENDSNDSVNEKPSGNFQDTLQNNKLHNGFIRGERGIEVQVHNNKIILGTKPAGPVETKSEHFEKNVKPYCAVVVLEDFGVYLNNSSRYCNQCLIFFPTNSDYNTHKRKIHIESINNSKNVQEKNAPKPQNQELKNLKAVDCNSQNMMVQKKINKNLVRTESNSVHICIKCNKVHTRRDHLRLHLIKFHKISKDKLPEFLPDRRVSHNECFHCKKLFRTQNLLIEHIYSILQTPNNQSNKFGNKMVIGNKTNKDFIPNKINKLGNEIKNLEEDNSINKVRELKENKNIVEKKRNLADHAQNVIKLFRCNFCLLYFKTVSFFVRHMSVKHKTVKNFTTTKVIFDPKCKHCPKTCDGVVKYNTHLYKCHSQTLMEAVKESRKALYNTSKGTSAVSKDFTQNYFRCDLCFLYFSNIPNYYRHMTSKHKTPAPQSPNPNEKMVKFDPKCPYCPKICHNLSSFNKHLYINHPDKINNVVEISRKALDTTCEKGSSTVSDDDIDMDTQYYICNYCCLYFTNTKFFIRHMSMKHKMVKIPKSKKITFNRKCKFCPKLCDTVKMYNAHVYKCHLQRSNQVGKIFTNTKVNNVTRASSSNDTNQNGKECFRCHFCPSFFMTMTYYVKHMKVRHKTEKMPKPKKAIFDSKCKYCPAILNNIKIHNKHLYNNHYAELNEVIEKAKKAYLVSTKDCKKIHANVKKVNLAKTLYRCCYCSHYFNSLKFYNNHVMKKHKVQRVHEVKKIVFDPKCKYCSTLASDEIAYNKHLYGSHRKRINEVFKESPKNKTSPKVYGLAKDKDSALIQKAHGSKNLKVSQSGSTSINTEKTTSKANNLIVPISKSALFKCLKCDIHFLTIKSALDHSNHMEMLINWKCALCYRIFKDNDRWLHEKQHLFSHVFTVYDIDQSNISQILYKCSKCVMHFDESVVDRHHYECALKVPQSYMCKICDILVDKKAQICHEYNHKHRHFTSNDFIIIETTAVREESNKNKHNVKDKINTQNIKTVDDIGTKFANNQDKRVSGTKTNIPKKNLKRKIKKDEKNEVLKSKKIKIDQNAYSSRNKLKSKNDNINNSSGVIIHQRRFDKFLLKLSFCNTCNSFVSMIGQKRNAHAKKRCAHIKSIVCKDCGLKLSCKTLSTHRQMHSRIKNLQLQHFKFYDFKSGKRVNPPMPEYEKCGICDVNFISKGTLGSHVCSDSEYTVCDICKIKLFKPVFHLHMAFHKYRTNETSAGTSSDNAVVSNKTIEVSKNNKNILLLLFCCKVCYVFVDTYDRLVEHCQKHCLNNLSSQSEECKICNLPFEENCLKRHEKIHELGVSSFEKLFYDPFYFRFDHTVWLNHLFGSHSHLNKEAILLNSVYRHEHRFKMEIAQEGSPDLTLYKCEKCNRHVESDVIYQHVKDSCSNLRKYPCPICQLDFISSFSLQRHKEIHKDSKTRRYRIIHFNKQEDAQLTKVILSPPKLYVLYQCRHCHVVVGSTQRTSHKCNKKAFTTCSDCGLLINEDIYELHSSMHKTLDSFISENMKVILFGQYQLHDDKYVAMESSFRGKIHDYSFYKCSKCNVCVQQKSLTLYHTCGWKGQPRVACSICGLYFYADKLITHIKNHETDPDFILDNMIFIEFHPSIPRPKDDELQNQTRDKESSPNVSIDLDTNNELENAKQTLVVLEDSKDAEVHPEKCKDTAVSLENATDIAISRENTEDTEVNQENAKVATVSVENKTDASVSVENEKDGAVSDEKATDTTGNSENAKVTAESLENAKDTVITLERVKENAVSLENALTTADYQENEQDSAVNRPQENDLLPKEKVKESEKTANIYQCKCGLHFLDEKSISEHFSLCGSKSKQAKQNCSKCGLLFTPNVLFKHLLTHHGDKNHQFKINIVEKSNNKILYLQKEK